MYSEMLLGWGTFGSCVLLKNNKNRLLHKPDLKMCTRFWSNHSLVTDNPWLCSLCCVLEQNTSLSSCVSLPPPPPRALFICYFFYKWIPVNLMLDVTLRRTSIPSRGVRHTPGHFMLQKPEISNCCIGGPLTQDLNADTFYMCISSIWNTITSIYFIRLNKSLHLFEMHCPFLNPNLDFYRL